MRQTFGPILLHLGLTFDYVETSKSLDQSEVDKDVREVTDTYKVFAEKDLVDKNCLVSSSRHFLTMKALIRQHNLDSLAVRCWPELPGPPSAGGMDQWCYMALARLASDPDAAILIPFYRGSKNNIDCSAPAPVADDAF